MSAFFVSRPTIHDTVFLWDARWPASWEAADLNALGRRLWRMNAEAMVARYPSIRAPPELAGYERAAQFYVYRAPTVSTAQLAKSATCLRYQCAEGDIPETSDLWRHLDALCKAVGEPEGFDEAIWDRPEV